jgi:hypothetical protein
MAMPDLDQLAAWLDAGRIDQLDLYVGEIFPNQYGAEYARALEMAKTYGCRLVVARNHSKVMLMSNAGGGLLPGQRKQRQRQHQPAHRTNQHHGQPRTLRILCRVFRRSEHNRPEAA